MTSKGRALVSNLSHMIRPAAARRFPGVLQTFMARDALSLSVAALGLRREDKVLLPSYLCSEVERPFSGKTTIGFYDVPRDLNVDPEVVRRNLTPDVKVVVLIHYFGFLQPHIEAIKRHCAERGVTLIEDCAHSLFTPGAGDTGDLSVYSFRKFLPVPDGGGLKVNVAGLRVAPNFYPVAYATVLSMLVIVRSLIHFKTDLLSRAWFASRFQKPKTGGTTSAPITGSAEPASHGSRRTLPMSWLARNGIENVDVAAIIEQRRADYAFWLGLAERTGAFSPVFRTLPDGVCPLGCPVVVDERDRLRAQLLSLGVETTVEWRLPASVGSEFPDSHTMSRTMLTLPVHPTLPPSARQKLLDAPLERLTAAPTSA